MKKSIRINRIKKKYNRCKHIIEIKLGYKQERTPGVRVRG